MTDLTAPQQERRRETFASLVSLIGDENAMQALNLIDQAGIESEDVRGDVVDALIASIKKGQEWATGETAAAVHPCAVCEGAKFSRSARGPCRACRGHGRTQVKCRACAELDFRARAKCSACLGTGQLDPGTQRDLILRQHAEWWRKTMETTKGVVGPTEANRERREEWSYRGYVWQSGPDGKPPWRTKVENGAEAVADVDMAASIEVTERMMDAALTYAIAHGATGRFVLEATRAAGVEQRRNERDNALAEALRKAVPYQHDPGPIPRTIASALVRAQKHIRKVPKASENAGDGYEYTSAEAIIEEARTALHQEGLAVAIYEWAADDWSAVPGQLAVTFLLLHESGEQHVCRPVRMPIVEDGGKDKRAPDKALATALTYTESQWLRTLLQIPRIGRSEDADARSDVGDGGRRRQKREEADRAPLSSELNDTVVALYKAIETAKTAKALDGVQVRLEKESALPGPVAEKIRAALASKRAELEGVA